jgi:Pentapeptide repeats (8 copies)
MTTPLPPTPAPYEDPKDYLEVANGASDAAWSSWLAFLLLLTYVIVTLAGVSPKALLLDSPVKLPLINADIPLVGFFQYAPALLLLVYLSLLIQHVILARKYRKFTEAIAPYELETGSEHPARERVHSYVFSQIAAGPRPNVITKFMMQLFVYVTFSILPIATLLYFQVKFLPYQDVSITYWHRIAVILGFGMLVLLTPLMQNRRAAPRRWNIRYGPQAEAWEASGTQAILVLILLPLVLFFSWLIATVPNEWIDRRLGFVAPVSIRAGAEDEARLLNPIVRRVVYDNVANGDNRTWWRRWLLAYRVLIVEDTDLSGGDTGAVLRERNFRFALLNRSDLHRADLTWADLRATQMWKSLAKGKLKDAQLQGAFLKEAQLQGAQMHAAKLQGADLSGAKLQGAELNYANLRGADLRGAKLQGADLSGANLQGADLREAQLQGANLAGAKLQGADLTGAEIWLVKFPPDLAEQTPPPLGLTDLGMTPQTPEARAQLKQDLNAGISDPTVLMVVLSRLDGILRDEPPAWDDSDAWTNFAATAREPSAGDLARFHATLACNDSDGTIANRMASRTWEVETEGVREGYAKPFSRALLAKDCKGGMALTQDTRAALKALVAKPE